MILYRYVSLSACNSHVRMQRIENEINSAPSQELNQTFRNSDTRVSIIRRELWSWRVS